MRHLSLLVVLGLALSVAYIAARVEYQNAAAGYYLPRTHPLEVGKWRTTYMNEDRWRRFYGPRDEGGQPVARELTAGERQQMRSDIARINATDELRDWIGSAGLLQYLLLPLLLVAMVKLRTNEGTRWRTPVLGLASVIFVLAFASLWHRQYFSSLGW